MKEHNKNLSQFNTFSPFHKILIGMDIFSLKPSISFSSNVAEWKYWNIQCRKCKLIFKISPLKY